MSTSTPVIVCGKKPEIARAVKASLYPEYEGANHLTIQHLFTNPRLTVLFSYLVIHVILSVEAGVSVIPALLRGERLPSADEENIGTRNYLKPPAAIVTGGGYDDANVKEMRDACKGESNVPWLRPDMSALPPQGPEFGSAMAEKIKACLYRLMRDGKMNEDGMYHY